MAKAERNRGSPPTRTPGYVPDMFTGLATAACRSFFSLDTMLIAKLLLLYIGLFSFLPNINSFPNDSYFVQKHNFFNQYGVKIGWFWTLIIVCPFVFFTSRAHAKDRIQSGLIRMAVATVCWYIVTSSFHKVLEKTSYCVGHATVSRTKCSQANGVWTPGWDISGHIFLMTYSILIMCEEASAFKNWNQLFKRPINEGAEAKAQLIADTKIVTYFYIAMGVLTIVWIIQIGISCVHYHLFIDKVAAAGISGIVWFFTYRRVFRAVPNLSPIERSRD